MRPAHSPVARETATPTGSVGCSIYQLCGYSMPPRVVPLSHQEYQVLGDKGCSDLQMSVSKSV